MKAVVLHATNGAPESFRFEEVSDPLAGPEQVLVRLKAAALNHRDVWIRKGQYADIRLPAILGSDGAGEVVAVGDRVDAHWVGKPVIINPSMDWGNNERVQEKSFRVLGMPDNGTYAELIAVPAKNILLKPDRLTFEEAAAIPLGALTAYRALVTRARLKAGETVVITGIGGGVSSFALMIAKALGARAIVTSRSDEKLQQAAGLNADHGFNIRTQPDWAAEITRMGVDVVIDSVGGDMLEHAVDIVKPGGRIVLYGATAGLAPNLNLRKIFWKQIDLLGSTMGSHADFEAMVRFFEEKQLRPVVAHTFPLQDAVLAHQYMEEARQFGKIVLTMS